MGVKTKSKKRVSRKKIKKVTGSEAILMCLLEEGVDLIYGYPGGAIMPVYDALMREYPEKLVFAWQHQAQGQQIFLRD